MKIDPRRFDLFSLRHALLTVNDSVCFGEQTTLNSVEWPLAHRRTQAHLPPAAHITHAFAPAMMGLGPWVSRPAASNLYPEGESV
jgi:hypothetical protein